MAGNGLLRCQILGLKIWTWDLLMKYNIKITYRFFHYFVDDFWTMYFGYKKPYNMSEAKEIMYSDDYLIQQIWSQHGSIR